MRGISIRMGMTWPLVLCFLAWMVSRADAQECDCNRHIGVCQATGNLDLQQEKLSIRANTNQCAQVIYYVDEQPGSMTVTGGFGVTDFFRTNNRNHVLSVDSCSICSSMSAAAPDPCSLADEGCRGTRKRRNFCFTREDEIAECGDVDSIRNDEIAQRHMACQRAIHARIDVCLDR